MKARAALFGCLFVLAGCANLSVGNLRLMGSTTHTMHFEPMLVDDVARPVRMETNSGVLVATSHGPKPRILFSIADSPQAYRATRNSCLRLRSASGELLQLVGVSTPGFRIPEWSTRMAAQYGAQELYAERQRLQSLLNSQSQQMISANNWIRTNPTAYGNGACPLLDRGPMIPGACTPESAAKYAQQQCDLDLRCAIGPELFASLLARKEDLTKLDKQSPGFTSGFASVVSTVCTAEAMRQRGENFLRDTDWWQVGMTWLGTGGLQLLGEVLGLNERDARDAAIFIAAVSNRQQCLAPRERICRQRHADWLNGPNFTQSTCLRQVDLLARGPAQMEQTRTQIAAIEKELASLNSQARLTNQQRRNLQVESCS